MKEITRRLYTKPVMLGMAFLVGMALLVGLFVTTTKSRASSAGFPVVAGNDEFETTATAKPITTSGALQYPRTSSGRVPNHSTGLVTLVGVPLSAASRTDTIIQRHQTVSAPGGSTPITMTGLSLKSISTDHRHLCRRQHRSPGRSMWACRFQGFDRDDDNSFQCRLTRR